MTLLSDNAFVAFPDRLHWDAQDLANAVPLRLFELYAFDPADARPSANRAAPRIAHGRSYVPPATQSAMFRIRG
jgi:hypothetical protein